MRDLTRPVFSTLHGHTYKVYIAAVVCLLGTLAWNVEAHHSLRPAWWVFSRASAWILLTTWLFFALSLVVELHGAAASSAVTDRSAKLAHLRQLVVHRDRFYTIVVALAMGLLAFWMLVVLPFTPRFHSVHSQCADGDDDECVTASELAVLCLMNVLPALFMAVELGCVEHKYAYRNKYLELFILTLYVVVFLVWSLVCSVINEDWPYYVQHSLADNIVVSFFLHLAMVLVFIAFYFVCERATAALWSGSKSTNEHYTDRLLDSIMDEWRRIPAVSQYEIQTFETPHEVQHETSDWDNSGGNASARRDADVEMQENDDGDDDSG